MFIDTHTHIYTDDFDADRDAVVDRARQAGAGALLLPGIDEASLGPMLDLCRRHPGFVFPMLGLHPTELPPDANPLLDRMERLLDEPDHPYVGIGETGIDLYWDDSRRTDQIAAFARQAGWAARHGLPLIVHARAAHREVVDTLLPLREALTAGGIFHCFGGTAAEAGELLTLFPRFVLGIGGVVTFKKSALPEVLADVPLGRIVLETDAPYLAPVPHRGHRNEPAYIPHIIARLAEVYGCTPAEVARTTTNTARRLFRLPAATATPASASPAHKC